MIPAAFDYVRARSLDDALARLAAGAGSAKAIAGGQSLLPLMKLRLARPETLIDIGRLVELRGVRPLPDGRVAVGALTTYDEMMADDILRHYGLLKDALPNIGDVQVRNRGTIGGSIAHADPASDMPAILLALDAEIVARSARGERSIPATSFFEGAFATALEPDELITEIRLPGGRDDVGSAYRAIEQPASGYSIAGVAAVIGGHDGLRLAVLLGRRHRGGGASLPGLGRRGGGHVRGLDRGRRCPRLRRRRGRLGHPRRSRVPRPRRDGDRAAGAGGGHRPARVRVAHIVLGTAAPADLAGAVLTRDLEVAGERWAKGRRALARGPGGARPGRAGRRKAPDHGPDPRGRRRPRGRGRPAAGCRRRRARAAHHGAASRAGSTSGRRPPASSTSRSLSSIVSTRSTRSRCSRSSTAASSRTVPWWRA